MGIKLTPPRQAGTLEERVIALEKWAKRITNELNIVFDTAPNKEDENGSTEK